ALKPDDPIRIVKVEGFDETPCGGTHVRRSGEVGAVAIRSWERFKGGTRVSFVCGARVVRAFARLGSVVDACVGRLSSPPDDLATGSGRLQEQLAESRRSIKRLSESLVDVEAVERDRSARVVGALRVIVGVIEGRSADDLHLLARRYVSAGSRAALLASTAA